MAKKSKNTENIEEVVESLNPVEVPVAEETVKAEADGSVVSAKDSTLDQTVSAVNTDAAIFNRQGVEIGRAHV